MQLALAAMCMLVTVVAYSVMVSARCTKLVQTDKLHTLGNCWKVRKAGLAGALKIKQVYTTKSVPFLSFQAVLGWSFCPANTSNICLQIKHNNMQSISKMQIQQYKRHVSATTSAQYSTPALN